MSKFLIYQIDHHDPVKVGRRRRIQFTIVISFVMVIWSFINIGNAINSKMTIVFVLIFPFAILIFILNLFKMRKEANKIRSIGEIEFTTSLLRKRIGDCLSEYSYSTIQEIEIQSHIPSSTALDIKYACFSYILKINFTDLHSESIVVSGKSCDRRKKVTILETMKSLKKMTQLKIKLP